MTTATLQATIVDGMIKPDVPLGLPNQSRVRITVQPALEDPEKSQAAENPSLEALERFRQRLKEHPINSGGLRYTREQLHERD